jgi:hypothetical protein
LPETFCRRGGGVGEVTTAGRSAVARVESCNAIAALSARPRLGDEIIRRAAPPQPGQSITSGRAVIEYRRLVVAHPDSQRNTYRTNSFPHHLRNWDRVTRHITHGWRCGRATLRKNFHLELICVRLVAAMQTRLPRVGAWTRMAAMDHTTFVPTVEQMSYTFGGAYGGIHAELRSAARTLGAISYA